MRGACGSHQALPSLSNQATPDFKLGHSGVKTGQYRAFGVWAMAADGRAKDSRRVPRVQTVSTFVATTLRPNRVATCGGEENHCANRFCWC